MLPLRFMDNLENLSPKELGYRVPAEWEPHRATWLSYPHSGSFSWPGNLPGIFSVFNRFIKEIARGEEVCINVSDERAKGLLWKELEGLEVNMDHITLYLNPTNAACCRTYGPTFLLKAEADEPKMALSWRYNGQGGRYPHDLDEKISMLIAQYLDLHVFYPGITLEGGAVDSNGRGTLLTTTASLLNEAWNPTLFQHEIEESLRDYCGADQILWLEDGIEGDYDNGLLDNITRFIREDAVITMVEPNKLDANYKSLKENLQRMKRFRLLNGKQIDVAEIPMPPPVVFEDQRFPASYANFYISNHAVIVPTFRCREDDVALSTLEESFPDRKVIGLDSLDIIRGFGSWHTLALQEPL